MKYVTELCVDVGKDLAFCLSKVDGKIVINKKMTKGKTWGEELYNVENIKDFFDHLALNVTLVED